MRSLPEQKVYEKAYIYSWSDPRDGNVFYVGSTVDVKSRCREAGYKRSIRIYEKFKELKSENIKPVLSVIEEVLYANRSSRELHWISYYHLAGHKLCNSMQIDSRGRLKVKPKSRAENIELASIGAFIYRPTRKIIERMSQDKKMTMSEVVRKLIDIGLAHIDEFSS